MGYGEGLYLKRHVKAGVVVAFYNGVTDLSRNISKYPLRCLLLDQTGGSGARGARLGGEELQDPAGGGQEDGRAGGHEAYLAVQGHPRP